MHSPIGQSHRQNHLDRGIATTATTMASPASGGSTHKAMAEAATRKALTDATSTGPQAGRGRRCWRKSGECLMYPIGTLLSNRVFQYQ